MSATPARHTAAATQRLAQPAASVRRRHLHGAIAVGCIVALTVAGLEIPAIALLAAGAGAGYSLSGSV